MHRDELRAQFAHVFVDEYQDTDPGQVALLQALAGDGAQPHRRRRPAPVDLRLPRRRGPRHPRLPRPFRRLDGGPADVLALRVSRRFGPRLLAGDASGWPRGSRCRRIDAGAPRPSSHPRAGRSTRGRGPGRGAHLRHRAGRGRAARRPAAPRPPRGRPAVARDGGAGALGPHLDPGPAARAGRRRRARRGRRRRDAAGRASRPSLPLLDALRAVLNLDNDDPDHPDTSTPVARRPLLIPPLGRAGRHRRARTRPRPARAREGARPRGGPPAAPLAATSCARRCSGAASSSTVSSPDPAGSVPRLAALLRRGRERLLDAAAPPRTCSGRCGRAPPGREQPAHARRGRWCALPAVPTATSTRSCALFDVRRPSRGAARPHRRRNFLATLVAQQIPADTLAERGVRGTPVRLLTAHRSKGLEWRLVVVAHVQAEAWPDLRRRATLLHADRIGGRATVRCQPDTTPRELLARGATAFYVACTRARQRLVVTRRGVARGRRRPAVPVPDELGVEVRTSAGRPPRPLSLAGLVSELRRTAADPVADAPLRQAAARRLARLPRETGPTAPAGAAADPATWWGTRDLSRSEQPVRDRPSDRSGSPRASSSRLVDLPGAVVPRATRPAAPSARPPGPGLRQPGARPRRARGRRRAHRRARATSTS